MEERKLSMLEQIAADSARGKYPQDSISEQKFVMCVCVDLANNRNFPANTRNTAAFGAFFQQTGLSITHLENMQSRRMFLNEAIKQGKVRCDRDPGTARFILIIVAKE